MKGFDALLRNVKKLTVDMEEAAIDVAKNTAPLMDAYAKEHRKWTDRTGHARQGLVGSYHYVPKLFIGCRIYSKVDYAYWLEVIQGGKFAILEETRNYFAGGFFDSITARFKAKRKGL